VLGGQVITEVDGGGQRKLTNVYAGGELLAQQAGSVVKWQHRTPFDVSVWQTNEGGAEVGRTELDPVQADVRLAPPDPEIPEPIFRDYGNAADMANDVLVDGVPGPQWLVGLLSGLLHQPLQAGARGDSGLSVDAYSLVEAWDYYVDPSRMKLRNQIPHPKDDDLDAYNKRSVDGNLRCG
jgi:hypothetical protein